MALDTVQSKRNKVYKASPQDEYTLYKRRQIHADQLRPQREKVSSRNQEK